MASSNPIVGKVAREYCHKYPQTSTKMLAELLVKEQPLIFNSFQNARDAVRYHRGLKIGAKQGTPNPIAYTPPELPASDAKPSIPLPMPFRGRGIVMSDIHLPFHDLAAINATLGYAKKNGWTDFCILNGDIMDCHHSSQFVKDPRLKHIPEEIEVCKQFLECLLEDFNNVLFKIGNHEQRYDHYLMRNAPELFGLPGTRLHEQLQLEEYGIVYVPSEQMIRAKKLTILHGHETGKGFIAPVNPARGMFLRATACTLSGHMHRTSHHNETTIDDNLISCWTTGCLCDLHPAYSPINKWDHGFATLFFDGEDFEVETHRIIKGKVY